jgi:hypothetical protein
VIYAGEAKRNAAITEQLDIVDAGRTPAPAAVSSIEQQWSNEVPRPAANREQPIYLRKRLDDWSRTPRYGSRRQMGPIRKAGATC